MKIHASLVVRWIVVLFDKGKLYIFVPVTVVHHPVAAKLDTENRHSRPPNVNLTNLINFIIVPYRHCAFSI